MLQPVRRYSACLACAAALATVSGCGSTVYEARFVRAMSVLDHEAQKQAAINPELGWHDEDEVDQNGEVVRPSTGVRYSLPRQLRIKLERNEWPSLPSFVPSEYVLAVFAGELEKQDPKQSGESPLVRCYILAEKAKEQDANAPAAPAQEAGQAEPAGGLKLHQRVKEQWEQAFGSFEPVPITEPKKPDYGRQRRFDWVHPRAEDNPQYPQEDVHLYLFPATGDDASTVQVAIYFHIVKGPAVEKDLIDNTLRLSLETLAAGTSAPRPASGTAPQAF